MSYLVQILSLKILKKLSIDQLYLELPPSKYRSMRWSTLFGTASLSINFLNWISEAVFKESHSETLNEAQRKNLVEFSEKLYNSSNEILFIYNARNYAELLGFNVLPIDLPGEKGVKINNESMETRNAYMVQTLIEKNEGGIFVVGSLHLGGILELLKNNDQYYVVPICSNWDELRKLMEPDYLYGLLRRDVKLYNFARQSVEKFFAVENNLVKMSFASDRFNINIPRKFEEILRKNDLNMSESERESLFSGITQNSFYDACISYRYNLLKLVKDNCCSAHEKKSKMKLN